MAQLKRSMGFFALLALGISSMVSTETFSGAAIGAKYAGPASIISWIILGAISIYIASCFGELCAMFPTAGGNYEYAKQTYGRFVSYLIGWGTWVLSNIWIVLLAMGAINHLVHPTFPTINKIIIVFIFVILLNFVAYIGIEASAILMIIFALITVITLVSIFFRGLFSISISNFTPFFSAGGFSGIIVAMLLLAESIFGWESTTYLSEETTNPQKKIPKVIMLSTIFSVVINTLIAFVILGLIPSTKLALIGEPFPVIAQTLFGANIAPVLNMCIYLILIGGAAAAVISTPRLILAMARDNLFLKQFSDIHPKYNTPYKAIIFQTIVSLAMIFIGFGSYEIMLQIIIPLAIIVYSSVIITVTILRFKKPRINRPYKAVLGKILPVLSVIFLLAVMVFWIVIDKAALSITLLGLSILAMGIPIYFLLQMYYSTSAIIFVKNILAYIDLLMEDLFYPKKIRKTSIYLLGKIHNKKVLDYECNVGTLTIPLAKEVGKKGIVYASDISKKEAEIVEKRAKKLNLKNIKVFVSEPEKINRKIPVVDAALSVGGASTVQEEIKFLKHLNQRMRMNGRIVFMEYDKFFHIIPNISWLSDEKKIKHYFSEAGFKVDILKEAGILWTYIFIVGNKVKAIR